MERGRVLVVPAFAEEMNKSRPTISELARSLLPVNIATVVPDLSCTGDSYGEFSDARWHDWRLDLGRVLDVCADEHTPVTGIVGIRLGCALALSWLGSTTVRDLKSLVLWQPLLSGSKCLNQFLRLRVVAAAIAGGNKESAQAIRARLAAGQSVEVAGYLLGPGLATDLDNLQASPLPPGLNARVRIVEVAVGPNEQISQTAIELCETLSTDGRDAKARVVRGTTFWNATEVVIERELIATTVRELCDAHVG
jgi:exosortase A-associated hydrolase 2